MKEMLLWPKRTRIRNDGRRQWYEVRDDGAVVCEIKGRTSNGVDITPIYDQSAALINNSYAELYSHGNLYTTTLDDLEVFYDTPVFNYNANNKVGHGEYGDVGNVADAWCKCSYRFNFKALIGVFKITVTYDTAGDNYTFTYLTNTEVLDSTLVSSEEMVDDSGTTYKKNVEEFILRLVTDSYFEPKLQASRAKGGWSVWTNIQVIAEPIEWLNSGNDITGYDINPIHKIREILTDDTAMNKPESDVNDINFMKAADRIYDEELGISWSITEKSCLEAINELCGHIEAGVRVNRQTGMYEMVLFRDDWFADDEIHTLTVSKIKSMSLEVANADEAINQLNVSHYNRDAIKDSSFSIAENASIRNLNGRVNAEDADFPYFMNQRNAAVVAQWKLKQMSSPVWKGSFTTAEYNARKWNRYDLLKLAWPRKWQGTITVRIMKINLGTGTDVSIDFVEVVPYSSNLSSDIVIDEPIDVGVQPPLPCQYEPFEMPYYLAVMALGQRQVDEELNYENNFGLVGVVAEQPQSNSLYAVMMTHDGTEGEAWLRAATINYEPAADLDQIISRTSISFTVKNSAAISGLPIGTLIKCGSDWIGTPGEWMVFQGVDPYTGVVSVKRGALDTLPQAWGVNTKLYFCGNDVAFDASEYVAGEEVFVSALTTTPSGMLENKGSIGVEMNARAFRPYPPANVKINDEYWPSFFEDDLSITWVSRNRLQQTGGEILGWFDDGVTLEVGVTCQLILTEYDEADLELVTQNADVTTVNTFTFLASNMNVNTRKISISIKTVRSGFECLHPFTHTIVRSTLVPPSNIIFEAVEY